MLSLACVAADMANLNSFSLLPLGLAWMTSLHFSLYGSLKSVMEEKHTQFKHRDFRWQLHQLNEHLINWSYGKKAASTAVFWSWNWLLVWQFRGRSVTVFTSFPVLTYGSSCKTFTEQMNQFYSASPLPVRPIYLYVQVHAGSNARDMQYLKLSLCNHGPVSYQNPFEQQRQTLGMIFELLKKILSNTGWSNY